MLVFQINPRAPIALTLLGIGLTEVYNLSAKWAFTKNCSLHFCFLKSIKKHTIHVPQQNLSKTSSWIYILPLLWSVTYQPPQSSLSRHGFCGFSLLSVLWPPPSSWLCYISGFNMPSWDINLPFLHLVLWLPNLSLRLSPFGSCHRGYLEKQEIILERGRKPYLGLHLF